LRFPAFAAKNLTFIAGPFILGVTLHQKFRQITAVNKVFPRLRNALQPFIPDPAENGVRGYALQLCNFIDGIGIIPPDRLQRISVLPGHASSPLGSDQLSYVLNPPCRDFRAELNRLWITFCFDARPPSGLANGKDFQNVWQSYKARFRKYVIVHCDLPSFDQNQGKPMQNDNA